LGWNENNNGKLVLKGTMIQSQSGVEQPIGVFRGEYNASYAYYQGDEVTYNGSTYRYINVTASSNKVPTNTTYWAVIAAKGENATIYYTWIKYADNASGSGISNSPDGKKYIGFAYNKTTATESNTPSDYTWSLISGTDGVPGAPGKDGTTTYTWIKYSDNADGTGLYDTPTSATSYIGIAVNKTTATESTNKADYTWSKFKGDQGVAGTNGTNGTDGAYFEYRYAKNGSTTAPPTLSTTTASPSGWSTTMPSVEDLEYLWMTVAKKNSAGALLQNWSTPTRATGVKGDKGDKGDTGSSPALVYRGDYDSSATYYGMSTRVDAVQYNGNYYVARVDAGNGFTNKVPTNTNYWNTFGAQFESVATNLLLANNANIAGWVFRNQRLESQGSEVFLDGVNGKIIMGGNTDDTIIMESASEGGGRLALMDGDTLVGELRFTDSYSALRLLNDLGNKKTEEASIRADSISLTTSNYGSTESSFVETCRVWLSRNYLVLGNPASVTPAGIEVLINPSSMSFSLKGLPTTKPSIKGRVWRDGETLKIVPE
jgi:hypothetical protein